MVCLCSRSCEAVLLFDGFPDDTEMIRMDDLWVSRFTEIDPVILVLVESFGTVWYVWWFTACFFYVHHLLFCDTLHNNFLSLPFELIFIITF